MIIDPRSQLMRRTILRQVILGIVCCMRFFSSRVRKRFPSMRSLVDAGLMEEGEFQMMDVLARNSQRSMFWIPHMWAANIAHQARVENRIESDLGLRGVLDALTALRRTCAVCQQVEYVELPIVYTQVLFLIDSLVLYVGWLKVAQSLIDPYGEDESDFELNWLIDRHIKVTHVMEDGLNMNFERFTWKETFPWLFKQDWATKPKQFAFTEMINKSKKSKDPIPEEGDPNYIGPGIISTTTLYRLLKFDEAHMLDARYKD
ncbi:unnamed protein product [Darwinula stevensoni]|uniref:Bestrophin homolog n=1 Tax=Darwinula stevensoni TaxID=69355 RepID=A0A7R9FR16_9CRUS|nr:unnamed protein product [Darwinula stevensoni]CAG0900813.1 unnamed protein product [Darwinula stevensoni]